VCVNCKSDGGLQSESLISGWLGSCSFYYCYWDLGTFGGEGMFLRLVLALTDLLSIRKRRMERREQFS